MSLFNKYKHKRGKKIDFIYSDTYPHFSKKRCRIHHEKLNKMSIAYNNDQITTIAEETDGYDDEKCIGTNKKYFNIDHQDSIDIYKD